MFSLCRNFLHLQTENYKASCWNDAMKEDLESGMRRSCTWYRYYIRLLDTKRGLIVKYSIDFFDLESFVLYLRSVWNFDHVCKFVDQRFTFDFSFLDLNTFWVHQFKVRYWLLKSWFCVPTLRWEIPASVVLLSKSFLFFN